MKKINKAIILAGGLGTRMKPVSKVIPKEMFPIVDKPALQFLVDDLIACGINDILIISSKDKSSIQNYFENDKARFTYIYPNQPLGVADALLHAKNFAQNQRFLLLFGDVLFYSKISSIQQMIKFYEQTGNSIVGAKRVKKNLVNRYGCLEYCEILEQKLVVNIKEKPQVKEAPSNLILAGQYILDSNIFDYIEQMGKKDLFTDCLLKYSQKQPLQIAIIKGECFDIGSKAGFVNACIYYGLKNEETKEEVKEYIKNLKLS